LGCYQEILDSTPNKIVIDHHNTNLKYGDINIIDVCSSTCELVFKILKEFKYSLSREDYGKIYAGMLTDTNNLTVGALTNVTFEIAGNCYKHCKGQEIYKHFFSNNSYRSQLMFAKAIQNSQQYNNGKIIISKISKPEAEAFKAEKDNYTGIINRLAQTRDVDLVCFIYPKTSKYYVSLRAKQGYDASGIAKKNGGGGHLGAAAFETDMEISEIEKIILKDFMDEITTKNITFSKNPFKD
jgi:phosphoesterase RecJ-like protein